MVSARLASGDMAVNESRPGGIQSVHRALDILEAIARAGDLGASELSRELGLAVSTVHNLVRTLAARNYVIGTNGRYRLGPMSTVITSQWDPAAGLAPIVQPELKRLSEMTGQYSTARVLVGRAAQHIGYELGPGPVTIREPHAVWPRAITLPTGRILAAFTRPAEWLDFVEDACGTRSGHTAQCWLDELRAAAATGVCAKRTHGPHGQIAIAVPVWARGPAVICSLGCSAPAAVADDNLPQRMLDALWEVSETVSARLGCTELPLPKPSLDGRWTEESFATTTDPAH